MSILGQNLVGQNLVVGNYDKNNISFKNDGEDYYSCKKHDFFRIPSNCSFSTNNKHDILDHVRFGHQDLYCHECTFSATSESEMELHNHYQQLISAIFTNFQCDCSFSTNSFLIYVKHKN